MMIAGACFFLLSGCVGEGQEPTPEPSAPVPGPWPEDGLSEENVVNIELREDVIVADAALNDCVTVEPDRLVFPADDITQVALDWPVGAPIVGGRQASPEDGNNLFGFARKVREVRLEGGQVIVETEPAFIQDVVTGSAQVTFDPFAAPELETGDLDINDLFPPVPAENTVPAPELLQGQGFFDGSASYSTPSQTLALSGTIDNILEIDETYTVSGTTIRVVGDADFTGDFSFTPQFKIAWDVDASLLQGAELDTFEVSATGALYSAARVDFNVDAQVVSASAGSLSIDPTAGILYPQPNGNPVFGVNPWISKTLKQSAPITGPTIGPFPTTFRVFLYLDCRFVVGAKVEGFVESHVNIPNAKVGLAYDGDWIPIQSLSVSSGANGSIAGGGAFTMECGLRPQIQWRIADVGGPYANARMSVKAEADYTETCSGDLAYDQAADAEVFVDVSSNLEFSMGGSADLGPIEIDFASLSLYNQNLGSLWSQTYAFDQQGLGTCSGFCDDGVISGDESDVDCGGSCGGCADGRACNDEADCSSVICSASNRCVASLCEDERISGGEIAVDCGETCPGRPCSLLEDCRGHHECASGICSVYSNQCTNSTCQNGVQDSNEPKVDSGAHCATKCFLDDPCWSSADCASGFCSPEGICVADHCGDGVQNFDEAGVDCGGPTCEARCGLGEGCRAPSDCDVGIVCSVYGTCTTTCGDGLPTPGETDLDCGGTCRNESLCEINQGCAVAEDCATGICNARNFTCVATTCRNGIIDGDETGTDCGGSECSRCGLGKACDSGDDCTTGFCGALGTCVSDACNDGVQNGDETDVDCGGSCLNQCRTGRVCSISSDCRSGLCIDDVCVSDRCQDRVRNGTESDVDCGGTCVDVCEVGQACFDADDCVTGLCNQLTSLCAADACSDGILNGDETDVDCGGSCEACTPGRTCAGGSDCQSGVCHVSNLVCAADSCGSGLRDGDESDVDCGGSCAANCPFGGTCNVDEDCQSNVCLPDNTCAADACSNGVQDQDETDVDCGGACETKCDAGETCVDGVDCASGFCSLSEAICVDDHCVDGVQDADETDVDCGGETCDGCIFSLGCVLGRDCASNICNIYGQCTDSLCFDGRPNQDETDADCGGTTCSARCNIGQGCSDWTDCNNGTCNGGVCIPFIERSCEEHFLAGSTADGTYLIDYDAGSYTPSQFYCDMTNGGWTLVYVLSSELAFNQSGNLPNLSVLGDDTAGVAGLATHPTVTGVGYSSVRFAPHAGLFPWAQDMIWTAYHNGTESFRSESISLASLNVRIGAGLFGDGYKTFGAAYTDASTGLPGTSPYYWCGGYATFTDDGVGQANRPGGAPANCKGHNGLVGGYDFSTSTGANAGLTATGNLNASGTFVLSGVMSAGFVSQGYPFISYGDPGAHHAIWVK